MADTNTKQAEAETGLVAYSKTTTETITENFKDIMAEIDERLTVQFKEGRLRGTDYANVYASAMQTVLQLASQVETFEAKRASHERQWKLKVVDSLTSQHAMISNVLGTLDEANILPTLRDAFNDLYESTDFPVWTQVDHAVGTRIHYPLVTDPVYVCIAEVLVVDWADATAIVAGDHRRALADGTVYIATSAGTTSGTDIGDDTGVTWAVDATYQNPSDTEFWRPVLHWV